jgi:hypothetical protein
MQQQQQQQQQHRSPNRSPRQLQVDRRRRRMSPMPSMMAPSLDMIIDSC